MLSAARLRLYHLLFDQNRRSGRRFEGLCGLFALLSVLVIFIESGLGTQYHLTLDEWHIFVWLELLVTAVFTLEYLLRIATWPNPLHYIFSFWGLIDLATILPLYVMWLWPEISLNYAHIMRLLISLWDVGTVFFTIYPQVFRHEKSSIYYKYIEPLSY
ncbi:ion transporter, partial [Klebsiella pneumoniae]|uniref:ion transporter n=1 Tax=Klebsiella pneumoniae TaxID=573 RepID=UPI003AEAC362